jgi:hypothetical protein
MTWRVRVEPAAEVFLADVSDGVREHVDSILSALLARDPTRFRGGGYWEAMRGDMRGWFELRCTGPRREQFRLFCLLENGTSLELADLGLDGPTIVLITGLRKPHRTVFSASDYARVRREGDAYRNHVPRRALE